MRIIINKKTLIMKNLVMNKSNKNLEYIMRINMP